jgi:hypothetical protein
MKHEASSIKHQASSINQASAKSSIKHETQNMET